MLSATQDVVFARIEPIREVRTDWNLYEFRKDRGWRWLQKAAFSVLKWIGAHHTPVVTTYRRTAEQTDDLLKSLVGQHGQWINLIHSDRFRPRIYMGPDDHADLMALSEHMMMMPTMTVARIETRDGSYGKWHDIPIFVVPWMKGAIIVPA